MQHVLCRRLNSVINTWFSLDLWVEALQLHSRSREPQTGEGDHLLRVLLPREPWISSVLREKKLTQGIKACAGRFLFLGGFSRISLVKHL